MYWRHPTREEDWALRNTFFGRISDFVTERLVSPSCGLIDGTTFVSILGGAVYTHIPSGAAGMIAIV